LVNPLVLSLTKAFGTSLDTQITKAKKKKRRPSKGKVKGAKKIQMNDILGYE
jgi:hypothetical protein